MTEILRCSVGTERTGFGHFEELGAAQTLMQDLSCIRQGPGAEINRYNSPWNLGAYSMQEGSQGPGQDIDVFWENQ